MRSYISQTWNIFLKWTSSSNVLQKTWRKWQISVLHSLFPPWQMGVEPWTQRRRSVARPQNRCDQMRHGLWKSEGVDARASSRSLVRRLMAHRPSQCETCRLEELHPFCNMKRQNRRRRKFLSGEFFSPRRLTSTPPRQSLRQSHVFLLSLCFYFSHHMMNYSVLQPNSKINRKPTVCDTK